MNPGMPALALCLLAASMSARAGGSEKDPSPRTRNDLQRECLAVFSGERVLGAEMTFPLDDDMTDDLRHYHECQAFSRGDADFCDRLGRYSSSRQKDLVERCRTSYIRFSVIKINVSGRPDAIEACEELPLSANDLYGTDRGKECAWMTTRTIEERCRNPIKPELGVVAIKDCLAHHVYHADESTCSLIGEAPLPPDVRALYKGRCQEAALYRKAYRAKDAGLCGESLTCRMLMGEKACGRYLNEFRRKFCRAWAQDQR